MTQFQRKKKLINSGLQLRLVGAFLALGSLAALFQVVLINHGMLDLVQGQGQAGEEMLHDLPALLLTNVLTTLGVLVPMMLVVGIAVTHRVAGPAYRMREYLKQVARDGAAPGPCRIREGDELVDLCEALNAAMVALGAFEAQAAAGDAPATAEGGDDAEEPGAPLPERGAKLMEGAPAEAAAGSEGDADDGDA